MSRPFAVHVCPSREVVRKRGETIGAMVRRQVAEFGGYTVFFATSTQRIARACMDLERGGQFIRDDAESAFPWIALKEVPRG